MATGLIFDLKRFSIHDGPGIRSTVFLKGCPLTCQWCHNTESQSFLPELIFRPERCLACGECAEVCPHGNISFEDGIMLQNKEDCQVCGICGSVCYPGARELIGREVTAQEVVEELLRDGVFYEQSGGGVTFSGGEPLSQPEFLEECLRLSKEAGLTTALDTCGSSPWKNLERQLPYLDLILYDLKILDDISHEKYTGVSNQTILDNFQRLLKKDLEIIVRRPVIPGVNDSSAEIKQLGTFLDGANRRVKIDVLPYHALSLNKYTRLGKDQGREEWESR
jgi:pyruvate formate lyase activating enzyme